MISAYAVAGPRAWNGRDGIKLRREESRRRLEDRRRVRAAQLLDLLPQRLSQIADYVDAHRDEFGVEPICRALQAAPSTYYCTSTTTGVALKAPPAGRRPPEFDGRTRHVHRGPDRRRRSAGSCSWLSRRSTSSSRIATARTSATRRRPDHRATGRCVTRCCCRYWSGSGSRTFGSTGRTSSGRLARRAGHEIGQDQVARLMRTAGIEGFRRIKRVPTAAVTIRHRVIRICSDVTSPSRAERVVGQRSDLRADLGRCRLRVPHCRRADPDEWPEPSSDSALIESACQVSLTT